MIFHCVFQKFHPRYTLSIKAIVVKHHWTNLYLEFHFTCRHLSFTRSWLLNFKINYYKNYCFRQYEEYMYLIKLVIKYKIKSDTWIINHVVLFPVSIQQSIPKNRTMSCNMYSSMQHTCPLSSCLLEPFLRNVNISYLSKCLLCCQNILKTESNRVPPTTTNCKEISILWFVLAFKALFKTIDWLVWIFFSKTKWKKNA